MDETRAAIQRLTEAGAEYRNPVWGVYWTEEGEFKYSLYASPELALQGGALLAVEALDRVQDAAARQQILAAYREGNWDRVLRLFGAALPRGMSELGIGPKHVNGPGDLTDVARMVESRLPRR